MTLKALAYAAQQHVQATTGQSLKRTHLYELLAASFGFQSYAALNAGAVFAQRRHGSACTPPSSAPARLRCVDLGYRSAIADQIGSALAGFLANGRIVVLSLADLVMELRNDFIDWEDEADDETGDAAPQQRWIEPRDVADLLLLEGLEAAACKGIALAHYALALIHEPSDDPGRVGSAHWYAIAQQGRVLTGAAKDWADAHAAHLVRTAKHTRHLHEAARLGEPLALLDLADKTGDPSFFEQGHSEVDVDPAWVADLAHRLGRKEDAGKWLTLAAEQGDTEAMRELIEIHDAGNLMRCWTWAYLAELLGTDLFKDEHYAVHEDGSDYDDDVGGAMYVDGRDGIKLEPLDGEQDVLARQAAMDIFRRIQQKD